MTRLRLGIIPKLTLVFVLFAVALLVGVSALAFENARSALQAATVSELLATAIEKQAALDGWVADREAELVNMTHSTHLQDEVANLIVTSDPSARQAAHDHVVEDLQNWVGALHLIRDMLIIEPEGGKVIIATDASEEGKFREDRLYFVNGKSGVYVQNPYYDLALQGPIMPIAAPIMSRDGRLLAVLAGHLDMAELNVIIVRRTGLHRTDDAFLVNTSNRFVTQPRLATDPSVLQRGIHTEEVERCLARNSGTTAADDYRGVPALIVYRWLPERQLCLEVKIDQAEAFAPGRSLGGTLLITGVVALLLASALAFGLAHTITRSVHQLVRGAQEIGRGNLEHRIAVGARDELGQLAAAFNGMAANLRTSLGETVRGQRLLAALSQAAQAVQRAHTPEEVYRTVGDEVARLGYHASVFILTEDRSHLAITYLNFQPDLIRAAEKLSGLSAQDYCYSLTPGGFYERVIAEGKTVLSEPVAESVAEALPRLMRPLAGPVAALLNIRQAIYAPLTVGGERFGLLTVTGADLTEADVPAITTFANQTAIALENARLYQEARAWAAELEQRVQAQTEIIRAAEERLRTVVTNAPIVLWASDREGKFTLSEGKGLEPQGLKPGELVGQSVFELYRDVPPIPADNRRALNGESFTATVEVAGLVFDTHYSPMRDASGQVIGVTGVSIDITERKRAEEKLEALAADLERSNRELERFAYVASHDLQEPLRMVTSYLQLIERRYSDRLDGDAREFMGYAVDGANRMKALINDLLAYSRVGTRGKPFGAVDCETILAQATANLQIAIEESAAVVTHDPLPAVTGDAGQLAQLLQNLIGNAIKFHGAAPPRIHIAARQTFEVSETSKVWELSVRDNGIGIDPRYFDRIFAIFQRLHTRDEYPGTGIGLAMCKKIVERHGGRIWVESQPGQGATFYFTIPA